ncbi:hypothetical protein [Nonomuraea sp. NPDC049400]|uniref:hypothetical protein n=1 Tax=Nonomuraea sp. NPDC049400 TaxID=3364352 RepID=UPI00379A15D4
MTGDGPESRAWSRQFFPEFPVLHLGLVKGSDERFVVDLELPEFFGLRVPQFAESGEPPLEPQFAFGDGLPAPDFVVEGVLEVDVPLGEGVARALGFLGERLAGS